MDCNRAEEFLSFYVHEELDAADREGVEQHLQVCGGCTRKIEEYRVVRDTLAGLPALEAPPEFLVHVRHRLGEPVTMLDRVDALFEVLSPRRMAAGATLAALVGITTIGGDLRMDHTMAEVGESRSPAARKAPDRLLAGVGETLAAVPAGDEAREAPARPAAVLASLPGSAAPPPPEADRDGAAPFAGDGAPAGAAESFDDAFGLPPRKERVIADRGGPMASTALPDSPFLDREAEDLVGQVVARAEAEKTSRRKSQANLTRLASRTRSLDAMDADDLSDELGDMIAEEAGGAPAGLAVFAPDGASDVRARLSSEALASAAPAPAPAATADLVARRQVAEDAPPAISLVWLRTRFGSKVLVRTGESEPLEVPLARQVEVHPRRPLDFLSGLRDLAMAGLGLDLHKVVYWDGIEVEVLIDFGSGEGAPAALDRFVTDLRTLSRGDIASDVSLGHQPGRPAFLRVVVPNAGRTLAATR